MSEIDRLYHSLGGPTGYLGLPTGDEQNTAAGYGRICLFNGGTILWLPETGPLAHSGNIYWQPFPISFTVFQQNMALLPLLRLPNGDNLDRGLERKSALRRLISFLANARSYVVGLSEMWVSEERLQILEKAGIYTRIVWKAWAIPSNKIWMAVCCYFPHYPFRTNPPAFFPNS